MKLVRYLLPAIAGVIVGLSNVNAKAEDASFGCKILLCVASQNPSWQGVPYCVPPVLKLLAIRKVHPGYWPSCPEAGTHKPGYVQYEDCPAGTSPTTINRESGHSGNMNSTPACAKLRHVACSSLNNRNSRLGNSSNYQMNAQIHRVGDVCSMTEIIPRPQRKDPYYFDIRDNATGRVARYYFNLRR
ncbi:hypothetical protein ATER59S_00487 [Aquamicrobium terrae]